MFGGVGLLVEGGTNRGDQQVVVEGFFYKVPDLCSA
jgi:hypothetical protein